MNARMFRTRFIAVAAIATALGAGGFATAANAAAPNPPGSTPASCLWDGASTSHGGTHKEPVTDNNGKVLYKKVYECNNGVWDYKGIEMPAHRSGTIARPEAVQPPTRS